MTMQEVNGSRLRQALEEFGSLQKAIDSLQAQKIKLEADISLLTKDKEEKEKTRSKYQVDLQRLLEDVEEQQRNLTDLKKVFGQCRHDFDEFIEKNGQFLQQYKRFESFVAMLQTPPSDQQSIGELAGSILMVGEATWQFSNKPDKLRWLFVQTVLGNHLHCYRCDSCGLKFIANKEAPSVITGYHCPNCGFLSSTKPDDSFLKTILSSSEPQSVH